MPPKHHIPLRPILGVLQRLLLKGARYKLTALTPVAQVMGLTFTQSQGEDDEDKDEHDSENDNDDDQENVSVETESDNDEDDFVHPNLSTYKADDQEEEKANDNDDIRDAEMTDAQVNQEKEKVHVTFTTELLVVQQQSSSISSDLVSKFMNPTPDTIFVTTTTPSSDTIIPQTPIPIIQPQQQTHDSTTTTTIPATTLPNIPHFASLFGFKQRVSSLETELSELKQTNQFAKAVSSIPSIVDNYLTSKMKDEMNVAIQLKSNKLREEAQAENEKFLNQIESNIKAIIKDQVKAQVSKTFPKVEKFVIESLGAEVLARSSNQPQTSYAAAASLSEFECNQISTKISGKSAQAKEHGPRVDDLEESSHQEFNTGNDDVSPAREVTDVDARLWNLPGSQTPDREWNKTKTIDHRPPQSWITQLA
ncbi:hypothetical protein Tco_0429842 [Tanacetum coccineum]